MEEIVRELESIKERNARVEADKAWEISKIRVAAICMITYVCAALLLWLIGVERFWLSALVPVLGFYLSCRSLPALKKWWVNAIYRMEKH
ncbi:MAG: hypothetical protein C5B53_09475 [Candidatus Melainabacteria bacterium]|nr:MAG: hypothetical protein C5B53_09475 [Candidatus Melainabacteria bacterium]